MSRYRNVQCRIWNDDKFPFASDDAKLVFFHAYTNPMTTPIGIYKGSLEGLAADIRWPVERYRKAFAECIEKGFLEYDETFHVVFFPNFLKWNKPANPNVLLSWLNCWDEIPECPLKNKFIQSLKLYAKGWGKGFEKVIANLCERFRETFAKGLGEPMPKQEQEQEQEQEQDKDVCAERSRGDPSPPPADKPGPLETVITPAEDETPEVGAGTDPDSEKPREVILLPLNNGNYAVIESQVAEWQGLYPAVNVLAELRKMRGWLLANPSRRKTQRGILRFVTGWLAREQDRGRVLPAASAGGKKPSAITDDFSRKDYAKGATPLEDIAWLN